MASSPEIITYRFLLHSEGYVPSPELDLEPYCPDALLFSSLAHSSENSAEQETQLALFFAELEKLAEKINTKEDSVFFVHLLKNKTPNSQPLDFQYSGVQICPKYKDVQSNIYFLRPHIVDITFTLSADGNLPIEIEAYRYDKKLTFLLGSLHSLTTPAEVILYLEHILEKNDGFPHRLKNESNEVGV